MGIHKLIRNTFRATIITCSVMAGICWYNVLSKPDKKDKEVETVAITFYDGPEFVNTHLENIMKMQEEELGIKHFGIPEVRFSYFPRGKIGQYHASIDRIKLTLDWKIVLYLQPLKSTLDHELGHYYTDKLNESLGRGDWPIFEENNDEKNTALKLISEGIAEYFEKEMNGVGGRFTDEDWPRALILTAWKENSAANEFFFYEGGYRLVKPIIDCHGKKGIEYLITNLPTAEDLVNLKEYQTKVLEELSQ